MLRNLTDESKQTPYIIEKNGVICEISEAFIKLSGFSKYELLNKPFASVWSDLLKIKIDPHCIDTQHEAFLCTKSHELRCVTIRKHQNDKGDNCIYDITECKNAEEALRKSESRLRAIVTATSEVIYQMSPDWSEMHQLHGQGFLANTEHSNKQWLKEYIHPDDYLYVTTAINEAISNKSVFELEHRVIKSDGTLGWTFSRAVPIMNDDGEIVEWFGTASDITNKINRQQEMIKQQIEKERLENLEASMKMKDEFLYLITHEFRTPMAVVNSSLQAIDLLYSQEISPNIKKHLNRIKQNTNRQLRLVNNLLDITKISSGNIKLNRIVIDIIFVTNAIVRSVEFYAKQKEININFTSNISSKLIYIDEEKYERILLNLLSNALKFSQRGKNINVLLSITKVSNHETLHVTVKDEGIGIPKEKQIIIFERFGQVDSSLSRQAEGTGLGLHLVKLLVDTLNGNIVLESEERKGSSFTIVLPIINALEIDEVDVCNEANNQFFSGDSRIVQAVSIEFSDIYFD